MAQVNLDDTVNFLQITPIGSYGSTDTAVTVSTADAAKLPAAPFNLVWWQISAYTLPASDPNAEIVRVTNINLGTGVLTIVRAAEGPNGASTKNSGGTYAMIQGITEKMINDIQAGLNNTAFPGMSSTVANSGNIPAAVITQDDITNNPDAVDIVNAGTGKSLKIVNGTTEELTFTSTGFLGVNQNTPTSTFVDNGSFATAYRAITSSRTLDSTDETIDCTSGTFPVTLPDATTCLGREYAINNSGTGAITLGTTAGQTIDGASSLLLSTQWFFVRVKSDGSNWKVIIYNNEAIATLFSGSDIGAQINNAYAALPAAGGTILVPYGTYTYSTPIVFGTNDKIVSLRGNSAGATFMKYSPTSGNAITVNFGNPTGHLVSEITGITFMGHSTLIAAGQTNTNTSVGIYYGGAQGCPGVNTHDTNINGFGTNWLIDANAYMLNFQNNANSGGNGGQASTGALVHINAASNSGERNVFSGNAFTDPGNSNANNAIYITNSGTASNFFSSNSFDDVQIAIGSSTAQTTFIGNHFENAAYGTYGSYIPILGVSSDRSTQITFIGNEIANDATIASGKTFVTIIHHGGQLYAVGNHINNYSNDGGATITNFVLHDLDNGVATDYIAQTQVQGGALTNIVGGSGGVAYSLATGNAAVYNVSNSYTIGLQANANNTNTFFSGSNTVGSFDHSGNWILGTSGGGSLSTANFETTLYADQFSGSDMGAKINTAYAYIATLGFKSGIIIVPAGTWSYSTPIVFGTNGLRVSLRGAPGGGTTLSYTGGASTVACTVNTGIQSTSPAIDHTSYDAIVDITFQGPATTSTNPIIGVYAGGTNGAAGASFRNVNIQGFGQGYYSGANTYHTAWYGGVIRNCAQLIYIAAASNSGEALHFYDGFFVDPYNTTYSTVNAIQLADSATASCLFSGCSFDDMQVRIGQANNVSFQGCHFENPGSANWGAYTYVVIDSNLATNVSFNGDTFFATGSTSPTSYMTNGGNVTMNGVIVRKFTGSTMTNFASLTGSGRISWTGFNNVSGTAITNVVSGVPYTPQGFVNQAGAATTIDANANMSMYRGVATEGWSIPAIYGSGRSTAQSGAVSSVATYTVGSNDGSFIVSANVNVTTSTLHSFTVTCTYTDETNTSRVSTFNFQNIGGTIGTSIANAGGAVPYEGLPLAIRAKGGTSITIATTGSFTTVTYNVEGSITQIA